MGIIVLVVAIMPFLNINGIIFFILKHRVLPMKKLRQKYGMQPEICGWFTLG